MTVSRIPKRAKRRLPRLRASFPRTAWAVAWPASILILIGLPMVLSASWVASAAEGQSPYYFLVRQSIGAVIGAIALFAFALLPVRRLQAMAGPMLGLSILGLILVLTPLGTGAYGSRRWIAFGGVTVQPSELAKLAFILAGAAICARKGTKLLTAKDAMRPFGLLFLLMAGLVMLEPDLGTTTILGVLFMTILFAHGTPLRTIGFFGALGATGFVVLAMAAPYRWARVTSFLDPFADPEDSGYQAVQSLVALGSGGLFGTGIGLSKQKWLYVPNAHTDFIYAVIGEETGLVGTIVILAIFCALALGGIRIAAGARDPFGRAVAAGITMWLVGQAIVNIGAVTSVLPITGVPLPFVSYGNSALIMSMASIGMLMSIARDTETRKPASEA